jgi:hypothetical protein
MRQALSAADQYDSTFHPISPVWMMSKSAMAGHAGWERRNDDQQK